MENKKIIVFDFDKTLTYTDTLLGFYNSIDNTKYSRYLKLLIYFFLMIFFKLNLITNHVLKKTGFLIFLKGKSKEFINNKAKSYASKIIFNKLYHSFDFSNNNNLIIIISASYEVYLKYIFPNNVKVIGSNFIYKDNYALKFNFNCFSENKVSALKDIGVHNIDEFYTDSYSDRSLVRMSKESFIVQSNKLINCKNLNEFDKFFKK